METSARKIVLAIVAITFGFVFVEGAFGEDIVIDQNTTWAAGTYTYDNVQITNGATLTLDGAVTLNAQNLAIDPSSAISADGKGYGPGSGLGAGGTTHRYWAGSHFYFGGGGGYGGAGGDDREGASGGSTYGSVMEPTDLGSGGGSTGGAGGGLIRLVASTLTVNGRISADGHDGSYSGYTRDGGGGSGGSIYITTSVLTGSGSITPPTEVMAGVEQEAGVVVESPFTTTQALIPVLCRLMAELGHR